MEISFDDMMEAVVRGFEVGGVAIPVVGSLAAFVSAVSRTGGSVDAEPMRERVAMSGVPFSLGLEFLIIADIVMTVTVDPTLKSAAALGVIVLVRTFLSFSLEIEFEGFPALAPTSRGTGPERGASFGLSRRMNHSSSVASFRRLDAQPRCRSSDGQGVRAQALANHSGAQTVMSNDSPPGMLDRPTINARNQSSAGSPEVSPGQRRGRGSFAPLARDDPAARCYSWLASPGPLIAGERLWTPRRFGCGEPVACSSAQSVKNRHAR
jgi:uncharacterized membrane protein